VRLGVAIADAGGTGVTVGIAVAAIVDVGETVSAGFAAGDTHAPRRASARAIAERRLTTVR
jgi:hypothetical protein